MGLDKDTKLRPLWDFFVQIVQINGFYKLITKQMQTMHTHDFH